MMKLKVVTHDGESFEVEVEEYNPVELNDRLNDNGINTVLIGDLIISRINLKSVNPFEVSSVE